MMRLKMSLVCLFLVAVFLVSYSAQAQPANPQETLNQYLSDLQKNPDDYALREKIIRLVQDTKLAPAIPEAAREHYVMAATFVENVEKAKDNSGLERAMERAIEQYKAALLAAPWWADAYKKLAMSQKAAAHYDHAIASLNLYLLTQPADARDAQDEIYKLKALKQSTEEDKELAAKKAVEDQRAQQKAAEAKKAKEQEEFLKSINGARYIYRWYGVVGGEEDGYGTLDVLGDTIIIGGATTRAKDPSVQVGVWKKSPLTFKINGRMLQEFMQDRPELGVTGVISEDGNTITLRFSQNPGSERITVYKRER